LKVKKGENNRLRTLRRNEIEYVEFYFRYSLMSITFVNKQIAVSLVLDLNIALKQDCKFSLKLNEFVFAARYESLVGTNGVSNTI
jgi:hypothetical protein